MELHYLGPMMPCSLLNWNSSSETKTTLGFQSSTLNVINSSIFLDSSGSMICSSDRGIRHQQVFFVVPMQFVGVHWRLTGWIWSDLILWDMHIAFIAWPPSPQAGLILLEFNAVCWSDIIWSHPLKHAYWILHILHGPQAPKLVWCRLSAAANNCHCRPSHPCLSPLLLSLLSTGLQCNMHCTSICNTM